LAAVAPLTTSFIRFSADIYNDIAVTSCSVATLVVSVMVVRDGLTPRRVAALAALAALGLSFKATHVFAVLIALGAVALGAALHHRPWHRAAGHAAGAASAIVLAPMVAIGWFYLRNRDRSGSWFRSVPKGPLQDRAERTLADNLLDADFYLIVPGRILGNTVRDLGPLDTETASLLLSIVAVGVVSILAAVRLWRRGIDARLLRPVAAVALLGGHLGLLYAAQLQHATGYGAFNFRYFLPASLTIGAVLALAANATGVLRCVVVPALVVLMAAAAVVDIVGYARDRFPDIASGSDVEVIRSLVDANGVPGAALPALAVTFAHAVVALGGSLWCAHRDECSSGTVPADG
jgi:hypothetical protein